MGCIWAKFRLNPRRFFAGTIFTAAIGYLFKAYTARLLGADALGIYALGMTATGLASEIAGVGLCQGASKFVAAYAATGEVRKLQALLWRGAGWLALLHVAIGTFLIIGRKVIATQLYRAPEIAQNMCYFVSLMFLGAFTSFFGQALVGYKNIARADHNNEFYSAADGSQAGYEFQAGDIIQTKATFDKNGRADSNRFFVVYSVMLRDKADHTIFNNDTSDTFAQLVNVQDRFIDRKIPLQSLGIDNAPAPQIRIEEANSFAKILPYQVGRFQPR